MKKRDKTNPKVIGAAVLGAVALLIAAVVVFGSGGVIDDRPRAVIYFDGSVNGLSPGAPVSLRGVQVGEVVDVRLRADFRDHKVVIPVYVAFERGRAQVIGTDGKSFALSLGAAIQRGLRAQLQMQSVITGQLYVELGFMPDVPIHLVGADTRTPEIPAAPRIIDLLKSQLANMPLQQIGHGTVRVLTLLDALVISPEMRKTLAEAAESSAELHQLLAGVHAQVQPVGNNVVRATAGAAHAMTDTSAVVKELQTELGATLSQIRQTMKVYETQGVAVGRDIQASLRSADRTVALADSAVLGLASAIAEGNSTRADLDQTVRNLVAATRALRGLSENLERNPNALVTGRR